jgi:hypothetical protein
MFPVVATQRLGKHVPLGNEYTRQRIVGRIIFYVVHVVLDESVGLCISLSLLGNGSVNTFPRQQRHVEVSPRVKGTNSYLYAHMSTVALFIEPNRFLTGAIQFLILTL